MNSHERIEGLLDDLEQTLDSAAVLVARGRGAFDSDLAMRLAFEALSNRVGEVSKLLTQLDPQLFAEPVWSFATKNRDSIDLDVLWDTAASHFPKLRELARTKAAR